MSMHNGRNRIADRRRTDLQNPRGPAGTKLPTPPRMDGKKLASIPRSGATTAAVVQNSAEGNPAEGNPAGGNPANTNLNGQNVPDQNLPDQNVHGQNLQEQHRSCRTLAAAPHCFGQDVFVVSPLSTAAATAAAAKGSIGGGFVTTQAQKPTDSQPATNPQPPNPATAARKATKRNGRAIAGKRGKPSAVPRRHAAHVNAKAAPAFQAQKRASANPPAILLPLRAEPPMPFSIRQAASAKPESSLTPAPVAETRDLGPCDHLSDELGQTAKLGQALPLPRIPEPLAEPLAKPEVVHAPPPAATTAGTAHRLESPSPDLPRSRSLTSPSQGLIAAISNWLRSAGQLLASGFLVTKQRPVARPRNIPRNAGLSAGTRRPPPPSLREQTEMTQLRAENRRLRSELEAMLILQQGERTPKPSFAEQPKAVSEQAPAPA